MSKEQNNDMGYAWLKTNYAGSGPLKIREWRANEILALERNDNYYGEKSKLARVIYRHVKEAATQRLLLEKGDVDVARNLTPQDLAAIASNKDIRTTSTPKGTVYYMSLNQKNPTLSKPEVREAMKWLVDYSAIGDTLIKNIGVVHQNFLPVGLLGASTENPYKLDVEKAKALLAKAGVPNGFKVTVDMRTVQPVQGITEAFQQTAKRAGIDVEIIPGDGKQTLTKYRARQHDIYIGQWGADYWDPHTNADTFARNPDNGDDAKSKPLAWRNAWAIPELTKKADAAVLERDAAKRKAMYEEIQAEFRRTSPFIMLYQLTEVAAYRSDVQGLKLGPDVRYHVHVQGSRRHKPGRSASSGIEPGRSDAGCPQRPHPAGARRHGALRRRHPAHLSRPARGHVLHRPRDPDRSGARDRRRPRAGARRARVREELGLNKPLWDQFCDLRRQGAARRLRALAADVEPGHAGHPARVPGDARARHARHVLIGAGLGVPLGVWAAVRRGRLVDQVVRVIGLVGYSAPIFWLGLMALVVFYARWAGSAAPAASTSPTSSR